MYAFAKLVHLVTLVLWIGPPLGAYYLVAKAWKTRDKARIVWAERMCERVLVAEHIALPFLLGSGLWMLWETDWALLEAPWMQHKLWLLGYVLLFELVDLWVSHRTLHRVFKLDDPWSSPEWPRAKRARKLLMLMALPAALVCIPGIFVVAVLKL